ncbi:serine protease gd-like [Microplitis mediator]|uniref:serine protease gd-like n=1 Tax=Microplitis mediator TaxID=375433 RepID=UPI002556872E|nr:serine protease gd-like [Microplitis mediator]
MSEMIYCRFIVFLFICLIDFSRGLQSPCPEIFSYRLNPVSGEIFGRIIIYDPPKIFRCLSLRVRYQTTEIFQDSDRGELRLAQPKEEVIQNIARGLPIIYFLHFPLLKSTPEISLITLNNVRYCVGIPELTARKIEIQHNLFPPIYSDLNAPTTTSTTTPAPPTTSTLATSTTENSKKPHPLYHSAETFFKKEFEKLSASCGRPVNNDKFIFTNNRRLRPGQWPWLAAIFITREIFEFQCTGTLISDRHILTAAHCLYHFNLKLTSNLFIVSLGRYRISNWDESLAVNYQVDQIHVHPDYERGKLNADIAVFKLSDTVRYNWLIRPLCLWPETDARVDGIINQLGYVAGWGDRSPSQGNYEGDDDYDDGDPDVGMENEHQVAKFHVVPIVSPRKCYQSLQLRNFITNDAFCAGTRNGRSGPCNGDSGTALAIYNSLNGRYYLRGVASLSIMDRSTLGCDYTEYVIYVDVAKYHVWILGKIFQT